MGVTGTVQVSRGALSNPPATDFDEGSPAADPARPGRALGDFLEEVVMPEWLIVVLVLVAFFVVIPFLWDKFKSLGKGTEKAGEAMENATDRISDFIGTAVVKVVGIGALLLSLLGLFLMVTGWMDFGWGMLAACLVLLAYAVYLLTPGERSVFVFF